MFAVEKKIYFRKSGTCDIISEIEQNEMCYRGFSVDAGNVGIRVRNANGVQQRVTLEVDFACNMASKRYYIQSAWRMPDEKKMQQEQRSLSLINDDFRKIIVVGERLKLRRTERGIVIVGIYEFLLDQSTMDK